VANSVFAPHLRLSAICSTTDHAMLSPSNVLVPLPISSSIIRLFAVALSRIYATSLISTINVLCPAERSSDAPTRVNILSTIPISALAAGTNPPICAIMTISAVCRIYVDFPAMFGPVIIAICLSPQSSSVSFGMNTAEFFILSTTGWRPSLILITSDISTVGITYLFFSATAAREQSTSSVAIAWAVVCILEICSATASRILQKVSYSMATILLSASTICSSTSLICGVIYRSQFERVCFLTK